MALGRWAGAAMVLLLLSSWARAQDDAISFLKSVAKTWEKVQTFRMMVTMNMTMQGEGMEMKMAMPMGLTFQRPDKFRMTMEMPIPGDPKGGKMKQVVVSDGQNLYIEIPPMKQVIKMPFPKTGKMPSGIGMGFPGADPSSFALSEESLKHVASAKFVGKERIGGQVCRIVRLTLKDGPTMDLWIDDDTVKQMKMTMTGLPMGGPRGEGQGRGPTPVPTGKGSVTIVMVFHQIVKNPKLPANYFAYTPPAGFKVVEQKQFGPPAGPPGGGPGGPQPQPPGPVPQTPGQ